MSIEIHEHLKRFSHSSNITLHRCPRKYELYKLKEEVAEDSDEHLSYGSAVGVGVQALCVGKSFDQAVWEAFLAWSLPYADESGLRDKKTFPYVIVALEKFLPFLQALHKKYEVYSVGGKAAVELGFRINLLRGFSYRGYVDIVLRDKLSGELCVLELKTTKFTKVHEAIYKHSGQALGYSLILDAIAAQQRTSSAYKVLYYIYNTNAQEWQIMPFDKSYLHRALWLKQLLMDVQQVEYFAEEQIFPMHGESCYDFFKPCRYFGICELSNTHLLPKEIPVKEDQVYQFNFNLVDLIDSQLVAHTTQEIQP